ncbi:MAG TPA: lactonase family protein [Verrucomicrobiales bacterium]|nr:lactonase family protein [Verrucomicrobiales bacterium]
MKILCLFSIGAVLALFPTFPIFAGTVVYVSEGGHNRIGIFSLDEKKEALTRIGDVELEGSPGPLALSKDGRHLYASVRSVSQFSTLSVDPATGLLKVISTVPASGGAAYIHVDRTGRWLLGAYYGEGLVSVSRIDEEGVIVDEPLWVLDIGPKAHCIVTDPSNRFAYCPHPLDLNCVDQFRFDEKTGKLTLNDPNTLSGGPGNGPRHLKFHPNGKWAYLANEQGKSASLCYYDSEKGTLEVKQTLSSLPKEWDSPRASGAEIKISADGRFLYTSNRGHESITTFSIDQGSGMMTVLDRVPTEKIPRSFDLLPGEKFMVVAGQGEGRLVLYRRDTETGGLSEVQRIDCGKSPAWVMGMKLP